MKNRFILIALALLTIPSAHAFQEIQQTARGGGPYTPTKLEWLTVELNATYRRTFEESGAVGMISMSFQHNYEDTVIVVVNYSGEVPRSHINRMTDQGRQFAKNAAKRHDWKWVRVDEQVEELK